MSELFPHLTYLNYKESLTIEMKYTFCHALIPYMSYLTCIFCSHCWFNSIAPVLSNTSTRVVCCNIFIMLIRPFGRVDSRRCSADPWAVSVTLSTHICVWPLDMWGSYSLMLRSRKYPIKLCV